MKSFKAFFAFVYTDCEVSRAGATNHFKVPANLSEEGGINDCEDYDDGKNIFWTLVEDADEVIELVASCSFETIRLKHLMRNRLR